MKLIYFFILRISLVLGLILALWSIFFFVTTMNEVNAETDETQEDYSESIVIKILSGETLPLSENKPNNSYYITEVTEEYAQQKPGMQYKDTSVYLVERGERVPARMLTTIFRDDTGKHYQLVVYTPTIEKDNLKHSIQIWVIFLYIALLLCVILISVWVFYRNMRPLYVLLDWLDAYRAGKKNRPLNNKTRITEFRKLNEAVIKYADRTERLFERQKQFIGNASHEIQTPLAICLNRLEMMMEDESLSEQQLGELVKTHHTLEYITRLNKSLLLLTKIENEQFADEKVIDFSELLMQYLEDYKEVYGYKGIEVSVTEHGHFCTKMNKDLGVVLLTNLLKNAFVHNQKNGRIQIETTKKSFTIKNSSEGTPLDKNIIFSRFYKGDKKKNSSGLGLAIVDSICKLQHLNIRYYFEQNEHCFEITRKVF